MNVREQREAEARWTGVLGGLYLLRGEFRAPFPAHMHIRHIVGVVDRGSVVLSRGGRSWVATQGDLIGLRRYEVHEDQGGHGQPWVWRLAYARPDGVRAAAGTTRTLEAGRARTGPVTQDAAGAALFSQLFDALWSHQADSEAATELAALLAALFGPRADRPVSMRRNARTRDRVRLLRQYLHHAGANGVAISHLAQRAGLSPFHLIRAFRSETGLPPHAYYQQVRLARAKELLWRGWTLSDVAFRLGFSDQSHFCREFKRATQITPSRYVAMVRASGVEWATSSFLQARPPGSPLP